MTMDRVMDRFNGRSFITLETYRRNGQGVRTPVWFAAEAGLLYVRTMEQSGKVKRVNRDSRVRVVPSNAGGKALGEWVDGQARLVSEPQTVAHVSQLFRRKYGLGKIGFDLWVRLRKDRWATIQLHV